MDIQTLAEQCRKASVSMPSLPGETRNNALKHIAKVLDKHAEEIAAANRKDLERTQADNLDASLLKRLKFDQAKITQSREGIESLIRLPDPVGTTLAATELDTGLELFKVSRPIGVIGVIFESRPDALVQIASLCLKSGNAALLKGGSEAAATNEILASLILQAGIEAGMPEGWLALLETRSDVDEMLKLDNKVDLIIPRGSNAFVRYIMDHTVIPVLGHADGICHVYIDRAADLEMGVNLSVDSKCQYVAVCNAAETILVHEAVAGDVLPKLKKELEKRNVKILGCGRTCSIIQAEQADDADWTSEYLDLVVSVKVMDSLEDAVGHINRYGSGHTDMIVTADKQRGLYFMDHADTADAFRNCSTRFSDGFRFGLGAEVGISTNKIHARGPVGLEGLMTCQWRLVGDGHAVADYSGPSARSFTHKPLNRDVE